MYRELTQTGAPRENYHKEVMSKLRCEGKGQEHRGKKGSVKSAVLK